MNGKISRRKFLIGSVITLGVLSAGGYSFFNQPQFGRLPSGKRLERIKNSPHFDKEKGQFLCLEPVEVMSNKQNRIVSTVKWGIDFLTEDKKAIQLVPQEKMLTAKEKINFKNVHEDFGIWLGHSSFYFQIDGVKILLDPVFSDYASPVSFINRAFDGSNFYTANDFPEIDILLLTHDHYDHLDYASIMALKNKIHQVVCPLGMGEYFEYWNFDPKKIHEMDWFDDPFRFESLEIFFMPSQHFSGRFMKQNQTLWGSYVLKSSRRKIFCSGDGGYGKHFQMIAKQFGSFDFALMENGQYNENWNRIHSLPDQTVKEAIEIHARTVIPIHSGKFALARHPWFQPYEDLLREMKLQKANFSLCTPKNGDVIFFDRQQKFSQWWKEMK